ncbi:MAG: hypothetical protein ACOWWM_16265 [Desulfobacterales bacterium]
MEKREDIVMSPSELMAHELLEKEVPGERQARLQNEMLPKLEELQARLEWVQAELRAWRAERRQRGNARETLPDEQAGHLVEKAQAGLEAAKTELDRRINGEVQDPTGQRGDFDGEIFEDISHRRTGHVR